MYSYQDGWTPLLHASNAGATDVRCLLDAGADSKVRTKVSKRVAMYTYVLSFNYTIILYHMWAQSFDHIMLIRIVLYYVIVCRIWRCHYHQFLHYYYLFLLRMITLLFVLFISYVNICATNIFLSLSFWVTDFHIFYDFHISYYPPLYVCVTALLYLLFSRTFLFQAL